MKKKTLPTLEVKLFPKMGWGLIDRSGKSPKLTLFRTKPAAMAAMKTLWFKMTGEI